MSQIFAVLTGDLVRSTELELDTLERARSAVVGAVRDLSRWDEGVVVGRAEFFRGDSWQFLLGKPRYFLRAALFIRAALRRERKGLDTRIGVGFGTVDRIVEDRISLSLGDAFTLSGSQLDMMGDNVGISVATPARSEPALGWMQPMTTLCSVAMNHWSERQAEIAVHMLVPGDPSQASVASELDVSRQMVSKTLNAIEFNAILSAIRWIEKGDWDASFEKQYRHYS